jgi:LPPG:FO 2-phospho-L-lactate transferase
LYIALAGGVGGAKLALGLSQTLPPEELMIVVNSADDFDHLGLRICPDLDTVMYTLANVANRDTGWGLQGETWNFLDALEKLGGETWFRVGDRDLATHVERTHRLRGGETLSSVTGDFAARLGIRHTIAPVTDSDVRTIVQTSEGALPFQEYFVKRQCEPPVTGFDFVGAEQAVPAAPVRAAIESGDVDGVILCPSNPYVSIAPIIAIPAVHDFLSNCGLPVIAVSPIVGGRALKGPAARMMHDLGVPSSAYSIAEHYRELVTGMVIDTLDQSDAEAIGSLGMQVKVTNTVMTSNAEKTALARDVLDFIRSGPMKQ